ncbi:MAG: hypothetical protein V2I43_26095, partial [Parvularcula sp.]|nr:hypothetical protein [Parvularcula sp.]
MKRFLTGACALTMLAACATSSMPTFHVVEPQIVDPKPGELVAQIGPSELTVERTPVTDRTPPVCHDLQAEITKVRTKIAAIRQQTPLYHVRATWATEMQRTANMETIAKLETYQGELQRSYNACQEHQQAYRQNPVILAAVHPGQSATQAVHVTGAPFNGRALRFGTESFASAMQGRSCLVLLDYRGVPIPVRAEGVDRYSFASPYTGTYASVQRAQGRYQQATDAYNSARRELAQVQALLASNRAVKGDSCSLPAARAVPPKPRDAMSAERADYLAKASCTDQIFARFSNQEASEFFSRRSMYAELDAWQKWRASGDKLESCAHNTIDDAESFAEGAAGKLTSWVMGRTAMVQAVENVYS